MKNYPVLLQALVVSGAQFLVINGPDPINKTELLQPQQNQNTKRGKVPDEPPKGLQCHGCGFSIPITEVRCTNHPLNPEHFKAQYKAVINQWWVEATKDKEYGDLESAGPVVDAASVKAWPAEGDSDVYFWICNCLNFHRHDAPADQMRQFVGEVEKACGGRRFVSGWLWSKEWGKGFNVDTRGHVHQYDDWKSLCPPRCFDWM